MSRSSGPRGQALIGSSSAPAGDRLRRRPIKASLTLEAGDVNIFLDQSLLLAQSRVFTEQGGDMTIWSSNGDINAGKGAKTIADVPAAALRQRRRPTTTPSTRAAEVTGAGIATLQTIPDAPPGSVLSAGATRHGGRRRLPVSASPAIW